MKKLVDATEYFDDSPEICTRVSHNEGEEVFGSTMRKLDLPLRSEFDSH